MDFYNIIPDSDVLERVRSFMDLRVAQIINDFWIKDKFPLQLIPELKDLNIDPKDMGYVLMEMARVDPNMATFFLIQYGLVLPCVSGELWKEIYRFDKIGCFALTEPDHGSDISGGLQTTASKLGNKWIINGQKKWSGNAPFADIAIVWALDVDDGEVKGFIVDTEYSGFHVEKIENKFGLRCVQNGLITLDNVIVPKENILQNINYKSILRDSRVLVSWIATGVQMGAYELALKYTKERNQFGKPICSFQLIQELLAKILGNLTACQCLITQISTLDFTIAQAALAKAFTTSKMRESVAWAREIFGGNGITVDHNIGRFFVDAEAIYTYEGTYQINNLIVGKAITGLSAFT